MEREVRRYQNCPWYTRLWRRRHYVPVPFVAFRCWCSESHRVLEDKYDFRLSFRDCWSLAVSMAQGKMHWYYTMDEVFGDLKRRSEDRRKGKWDA